MLVHNQARLGTGSRSLIMKWEIILILAKLETFAYFLDEEKKTDTCIFF